MNPDLQISFISDDIEMLAKGCPLQYVLEKTTFFDLPLIINSSVFIPRPETEELVATICNDAANHENVKCMEIGTGSGAIAIALAKNLINAHVWATDISVNALDIAKKNAKNSNVNIVFLKHDILKDSIDYLPENFDIIVSNPPYIPQSEKENLHKNIVDYEPHNALFVPDEEPLIFYEAIANIAKIILRSGGLLYFEIHEKFHLDLFATLSNYHFKEIEFWNDINGKPRFIRCKKL